MAKRANAKPGGRKAYKPYKRRSHRKGAGGREISSARQDEMGEVTEYRVMMTHDSRHWQVQVDEIDKYGPVRVYDAKGRLVRTVAKADLMRPWQGRNKLTWNDRLFGRATDDRV